jgi:hypothetical protein
MAGTADPAGSVAADVPVDIPGWAIPVGDRVAEDPAADGRAAATPVEVIPVEVTPAATHITKPSCCRPQRFLRWGRFASRPSGSRLP